MTRTCLKHDELSFITRLLKVKTWLGWNAGKKKSEWDKWERVSIMIFHMKEKPALGGLHFIFLPIQHSSHTHTTPSSFSYYNTLYIDTLKASWLFLISFRRQEWEIQPNCLRRLVRHCNSFFFFFISPIDLWLFPFTHLQQQQPIGKQPTPTHDAIHKSLELSRNSNTS